MEQFLKWFDKNLPAILTGGGILFTGIAVATGIRAGFKTKETIDQMPDADTLDKAKACAKYYIVPTASAVAAMACTYGAHKEHTARYVALAGTLAVTQKDNKYLQQFKEKAEEKLGVEKTEEVKKEVKSTLGNAPSDKPVIFHDLETGYIFKKDLNHFWQSVNEINNFCDGGAISMAKFFEDLLGDDYKPVAIHDEIGFGDGTTVSNFRPELNAEVADDLSLVYTISYPYANLTEAPILYTA